MALLVAVERKMIGATIKQAGEDGSFEAVIATFGVVDRDGDIIEPGAFGGATVSVLPAHDSMHVPLGKARIEERGDQAIAVGRFNLKIPSAADWHNALKFDLEHAPSIQEWSWDFRPVESSEDTVDGETVRRLVKLDVKEVSPVLRGASVGTGTLSVKEDGENKQPTLPEQIETMTDQVGAVIAQLQGISEGRKARGRSLGKDTQLATIALAKRWLELNDQLTALIKGDMLPDDPVNRAAARFLYSETARHLR